MEQRIVLSKNHFLNNRTYQLLLCCCFVVAAVVVVVLLIPFNNLRVIAT